jgi:hypothetical protein
MMISKTSKKHAKTIRQTRKLSSSCPIYDDESDYDVFRALCSFIMQILSLFIVRRALEAAPKNSFRFMSFHGVANEL